MRTLNIRLIGGLAVATIVLVAGSYFLHGFQMRRHADVYLREARRAQESDRPIEAVQYFRRYVKLAPHDTEGLALYGLQLAELDQLQPAYLALDQALRREPDREEWRRQLVETAIALQRYGDARTNLEEHLLKRKPDDAALLAQLGRCHVATGDNDEAARAFEAAVTAAPQELESYILLAGLHQSRFKDPAEADRWMERMVAANDDDAKAYLARGQWRLDHHKPATAAATTGTPAGESADARLVAVQADARKALELEPGDVEALLFAARVTAVGGQPDEARELARRGLEASSETAAPFLLLAEIESSVDRQDAAVDWLRQGTQALPRNQELHWNLARHLVDAGRGTEAAEEIRLLRQTAYPEARLVFLEGRAAVVEKQWNDGIRLLERARPELSPWPELAQQSDYWLGVCYEQAGNPDQQLVALRRAVAADPAHVPARLGLASALLATGRLQEAQEHFSYVAALPAAPAIAVLRQAQLQILTTLRQEPEQRDWTAVETQLARLETALPDSADVVLLKAEALMAQSKSDAAARTLAESHDAHPEHVGLLSARVALAELAKDAAEVDRLIDAASDDVDDPVAFQLLKARTAVRRDLEAAPAALQTLWQESESLPSEQRAAFARGLSTFALAAEDLELAGELGAIAAAAFPRDLSIRQQLFDVAVRGRKPDLLDATLADVRSIEGEGPLWRYGRALRLVLTGDATTNSSERALEELAAARKLRSGWSLPVLLTAEIHDRRGDATRAADAYLEAISLGERQPQAVARAASLLIQQGRLVEADQIVRQMQSRHGGFTGNLTRLAAETSLRLQEFDRASDLTQSFAVDSDRQQDHLWAGQMLDLLGRHDEAETRLRRAIELDPAAGDPRIALVRVLVHADRSNEAEAAIEEAETAVPAEHRDVTIAACYEILGRIDAAETRYQKVLAASPDDTSAIRRVAEFYLTHRKSAEAEPHLRRLIDGSLAAADEERIWARRSLAIVLGTRGGRDALQEALGLLDANRRDGHTSPADSRARAIVLASQPSSESRQQAVKVLEGLLADERTATPDDRFLLAELCRRSGDTARAAKELRDALAVKSDSPRYLATYIELLLARNETSEAELWIGRLKSVAPQSREASELESQWLTATGKPEAAANVLVSSAEAARDDHERQLWAGGQLAELSARLREGKQSDAAETIAASADTILKQVLSRAPESRLDVAVHHARMGRIDAALKAIESPPASSTPEQLEAVTVAVMTCPSASPEHLARLQQILDGSLAAYERAAPLLVVSADLLGWRGHHGEAVERYRELLSRDADDVRVLNNLALVLALGEKRYDEGLTHIDRAIRIAGAQGALLDTRGLVRLAAGKTDEARKDFQLAIDQGAAADRYLHLAAAQWQARDKDQAEQTLRKAESLGLAWSELHPLERPLLAGLRSELQ